MSEPQATPLDRRTFMGWFSAAGLGSTLFPGVLWAYAQQQRITLEMIVDAEKVAGLEFTDEQREEMLRGLNQNLSSGKRSAKCRSPTPSRPPSSSIRSCPACPIRAGRAS